MNWESQALSKSGAAIIRQDPEASRRVIGSYRLMLKFYGLVLKDEKTGERGLTTGNFSQFYSLVLFKNFDKSNTGTLLPDEMAAALSFLRKPVDGKVPEVAVAVPVGADGGMPYAWFWKQYQAME